jgi:hypothetical protein
MDGDGIAETARSPAPPPPASSTALVISSTNNGMPSVRSMMSSRTLVASGLLSATLSIMVAMSRAASRLRVSRLT